LQAEQSCLGKDGPHFLSQCGNIDFGSVLVNNLGSLFRAANCTVDGWRPWYRRLCVCAQKYLPLRDWMNNKLSPGFWDSVPIVATP
jgi:hypothetical protein